MSSDLSRQYHSITFGDKNTWDDWHLVPMTRPLFAPPAVKTNYLEIPGADGSLDISMSLTGYPIYNNRQGDIEFMVMNGYGKWHDRYSTIMNYLHGRNMRAVLDDDPDYYYEGKFSVSNWTSDKEYSKISIHYDVEPYKWKASSLDREWYWDTFNFTTGVIPSSLFCDIGIDSDEWVSQEIPAELMGNAPSSPRFIVESDDGNGIYAAVETADTGQITQEIHIPDGSTTIYEFLFGGGSSLTLYLKGHATLSIDFKIGRL